MDVLLPEQGASVGTITNFSQAVAVNPTSTPIVNASFALGVDSTAFTSLNGVLTYQGTTPRRFLVVGQLTGLSSVTGTEFTLRILRNGAPVNAFGGQQLFENEEGEHVSTSDYVLLNPGNTLSLGGSFAVASTLTVQSAVLSVR